MIVGGIEEMRLDEAANEMYVADNYLGGRVMVFSRGNIYTGEVFNGERVQCFVPAR